MVPPGLISQTLALWCINLAESGVSPLSTEHRVNQSMVAWLERCLRDGRNILLPEMEFLWVLVGFPARLDIQRRPPNGVK